jgi:hypothetical protein
MADVIAGFLDEVFQFVFRDVSKCRLGLPQTLQQRIMGCNLARDFRVLGSQLHDLGVLQRSAQKAFENRSVLGVKFRDLALYLHIDILRRAPHRHPIDLDRRNAYADGHALPFFTARPDAFVEPEVVSDHADVLQGFRPVPDQRGIADRSS